MKKVIFACGFSVALFLINSANLSSEENLVPIYSLLLSENVILSGTIDIAGGIIADNDVNDPYGQNGTKNDPGDQSLCPTLDYSQAVSNPVTIAGYVNESQTGSLGESYWSGDVDDYYHIDLKAGQVITLNIADPDTGDLDLDLYQNCTLVAQSVGTDKTEQIVVTSDGTYYIDVYPYNGFSNYVLSVGQNTGSQATGGLNLTDEFVVNEVIVALDSQQALPAGVVSADAAAASYGMVVKAGALNRQMLWSFDPQEYLQQQVHAVATSSTVVASAKRDKIPQELLERYDTLQAIKALQKQPGIKYAEPNYIRTAALAPNDTYYSYQWHYPLINLPDAWDVTTGSTGGQDVIVAVVDTGVLLGHEDLQGQLVSGYDFIANPAIALDGDGLDANPDDPGDQSMGNSSSSFHGTHVAGTVAAASNNARGVAGVSWGAKIMPLRVLGKGGGTSYDIGQACLYAARLANDSGTLPPRRAEVINMSIQGYGSFSQAEQDVYTQVRNASVIIIACSGNKNQYTHSYPGSYAGVVSVAAVDMNKNRAPYSNYHNTVDVAAPGGDTSQDQNGDGYQDGVLSVGGNDSSGTIQMNYPFMQGTSMASPHMAGVVALMEAAALTASSPYNLSPDQLDNYLISGDITVDIGTSGRDNEFGYGLIDANKAVLTARATSAPSPKLSVSPPSLNFGSNTNSATLTASNSGSGNLNIISVTDNASWMVVSGSGLGTYSVTADRAGLGTGTYNGTITFNSDVNDVNVPVIMSVDSASSGSSANAGYHYVLLIDPDESDPYKRVKRQFNVAARNGVYDYTFNMKSEPNSRYFILAGTDFDNDGDICDNGEACGAFLTLDQLFYLENIDADRHNLDFTTSFVIQLTQETSAVNTPTREPYSLLYKKIMKPQKEEGSDN